MDELEALEIYTNEIAPLEEMVGKLEAENNRTLAELASQKERCTIQTGEINRLAAINTELLAACQASVCAIVEPRIDWAALKGEIAYEKMVAAIAKAEAML